MRLLRNCTFSSSTYGDSHCSGPLTARQYFETNCLPVEQRLALQLSVMASVIPGSPPVQSSIGPPPPAFSSFPSFESFHCFPSFLKMVKVSHRDELGARVDFGCISQQERVLLPQHRCPGDQTSHSGKEQGGRKMKKGGEQRLRLGWLRISASVSVFSS